MYDNEILTTGKFYISVTSGITAIIGSSITFSVPMLESREVAAKMIPAVRSLSGFNKYLTLMACTFPEYSGD